MQLAWPAQQDFEWGGAQASRRRGGRGAEAPNPGKKGFS